MNDADEEYNGYGDIEKYNNITAIYFNINSKGNKYEIVWINKNIKK